MIVALGQINPTIGDFDGNRRLIAAAHLDAVRRGADLLVVPELALSGYPPKDLLERPAFLAAAQASLEALARATSRTDHEGAGADPQRCWSVSPRPCTIPRPGAAWPTPPR